MRYTSKPHIYNKFLAVLRDQHKNQSPVHEVLNVVSDLFDHDQELVSEFVQFLPPDERNTLEDNGSSFSGSFREVELFSQIKTVLGVGKYSEFVKMMHLYNESIVTAEEFIISTQSIFKMNMWLWIRVCKYMDLYNSRFYFTLI